MIIIDNALEAREREGRPIRVGIVGAGFMAKGFVDHVTRSVRGMDVVAICNRTPERAHAVYEIAGLGPAVVVSSAQQLDDAIAAGTPAITDDPEVLATADQIDCIVDMTGSVHHGVDVALAAFAHGKHLVLMNAEVDATVGAVLRARADAAGVVVTACDGDQPGVILNLWRFVRGMGLTPRVLGNVKGLQDRFRNPTTQQGFAEKWGQNVHMVTSFADGSKVNVEQAIVANVTGFRVAKRGMHQYDHTGHVDELVTRYDLDELREHGGIVEYVVGAKPGPGVFCLAEHDNPRQRHYLDLYKLGQGPLYSFYAPYHLCHFEVPNTVARAVLFGDAAGRALDVPQVEVVTMAKRDLRAGEVLDGIGGYHHYGEAENAPVVQRDRLLPQGLAEGCVLRRDVAVDTVIGFDDVDVPASRALELYREQWSLPVG